MAGITGQGDTFDLPNFVGELFQITPSDTPLVTAIGGLSGGLSTDSKLIEWETYDLRAAADDRQALEGADAPTAEERVRAYASNVVEIHQEAVEVSYTKQAAVGHLSASVIGEGANPIRDEMSWQVAQSLKQVARDIEASFITGTFQNPANNATPRKTRGLLEAITTNVVDAGSQLLTEDMVLDAMQEAWESGGLQEGETRTLVTNATLKRALTDIFIRDANFRQNDRNMGGVNVTVIETDFGNLNVMLDRYMPADDILILSLEQLAPVFLLIPGKGFLFVEPLAKVGAADRAQIYGEVGLKYGNEQQHAKIVNAYAAES